VGDSGVSVLTGVKVLTGVMVETGGATGSNLVGPVGTADGNVASGLIGPAGLRVDGEASSAGSVTSPGSIFVSSAGEGVSVVGATGVMG
jgi:hypothetical protein